jgi:predicted amino acid racemase
MVTYSRSSSKSSVLIHSIVESRVSEFTQMMDYDCSYNLHLIQRDLRNHSLVESSLDATCIYLFTLLTPK